MGEGCGVSLTPAETSSFIWSVNSKKREEGEKVSREQA